MERNESTNKNAFQWDAYCPLVDCIPACTVQGVSTQGVSARGVSTQGDVCPGGGVSLSSGVYPGMH